MRNSEPRGIGTTGIRRNVCLTQKRRAALQCQRDDRRDTRADGRVGMGLDTIVESNLAPQFFQDLLAFFSIIGRLVGQEAIRRPNQGNFALAIFGGQGFEDVIGEFHARGTSSGDDDRILAAQEGLGHLINLLLTFAL
jgi:hypothetical protein